MDIGKILGKNHGDNAFISQQWNQGPGRLVPWPWPQRGVVTSWGKKAGLYFWSRSHSINHTVFVYACFLQWFLGKGFLMIWIFHGSQWVMWGHQARELPDTAASPLCTTLFPQWQNCQHLLSVAEVLGGMKINKAWQLCSRVMTRSPPCHFQLYFSLSSLRVI